MKTTLSAPTRIRLDRLMPSNGLWQPANKKRGLIGPRFGSQENAAHRRQRPRSRIASCDVTGSTRLDAYFFWSAPIATLAGMTPVAAGGRSAWRHARCGGGCTVACRTAGLVGCGLRTHCPAGSRHRALAAACGRRTRGQARRGGRRTVAHGARHAAACGGVVCAWAENRTNPAAAPTTTRARQKRLIMKSPGTSWGSSCGKRRAC